jgi:septal ring factor EnvC (AmiA/AmiB activator)
MMWGRVIAIAGGSMILIFTLALWYFDHQKNMGIISNWQKDYNSLLTDKGNVNNQNVQLNTQNRQLVYDKQQLSNVLTELNQKIDTLSVQIDQLMRANELAEVTTSDLEKERTINKTLLDESGRLRQELATLRTKLSGVDAISIYENDCTGTASCSAICRLEGRERAIGGAAE